MGSVFQSIFIKGSAFDKIRVTENLKHVKLIFYQLSLKYYFTIKDLSQNSQTVSLCIMLLINERSEVIKSPESFFPIVPNIRADNIVFPHRDPFGRVSPPNNLQQ